MADDQIVYWKSLDELREETRRRAADRRHEFLEPLPWKADPLVLHAPPVPAAATTTRRDFLTLMGFSVGAAASAAACSRAPVQHAIPFVSEPEEMVPGVANWYATTCGGCSAGCGLLVKTRDGRPIKIEGNADSPLFGGGTCAVGQATVLSLYDEERLRGPRWHGQPVSWEEIDTRIRGHLARQGDARPGVHIETASTTSDAGPAPRGRIVLLSGPVLGPATRDLIAHCAAAARFQHIVYEPTSFAALRRAHQQAFGRAVVPHYRFDRAALIVGIDADFLGTWLSPVEFTRQYAQRRTPARSMTRHVQIEPGLSLTGANADARHAVAPSALGGVVLALAERVRAKAGGAAAIDEPGLPLAGPILDALASQLWAHRGESLIVCGVQDVAVQTLVAALNHQLGNIGHTIEIDRPSLQKQADDDDLARLVADMRRGEIAALIVYGVNPAYDYADAAGFISGLARVPLTVSFADRLDETASRVHALCPDHHFLEAWGDAEPVTSYYSLAQPAIAPMFDTRAAQDSLLAWFGESRAQPSLTASQTAAQTAIAASADPVAAASDFHGYLRGYWLKNIYPRQQHDRDPHPDPDRFWDHALQAGFVELTPSQTQTPTPTGAAATGADHDRQDKQGRRAERPAHASTQTPSAATLAVDLDTAAARVRREHQQMLAAHPADPNGDRYDLHLYESVAMRDGRHANNPWLQELPDPITKLTWGHALAIAPAVATRLGLQDGDVVAVSLDAGAAAEGEGSGRSPGPGPGQVQGQDAGGHARKRIELPVCVQPGQPASTISIALGYGRTHVGRVGRNVGVNAFPLQSRSGDGLPRTFALGATLEKTGRREALATTQTHHSMEGRPLIREATLRDFLADPAAGNDETVAAAAALPSLWAEHETARHFWGMAIDLNTCTGCSACVVACQAENNVPVVGKDEVTRGREMHWIRIDRYYSGSDDAPDASFQPVMCQHCANAPCETVCPVLATVHSSDGLNQQVYNRCIGTRYCENNCPYKVRRFNWFTYAQNPRFDYVMNSPLETMVLNPDVVVRSRGVMEKCSLCVQRIQAGKLAAKKDGRALADGDIKTACQQACPAQAITFGDLHDAASVAARLQHGPRSYHLLGDLGTRPSVGYLTKIRNREV
jgi:MoCo/4Fe-4S cofactor protein with predicted Tat translocation signal